MSEVLACCSVQGACAVGVALLHALDVSLKACIAPCGQKGTHCHLQSER